MDRSSFEHKKVSIIGAARSGIAAARLLQSQGADVFISDASGEEKLKTSLEELNAAGIAYEAGKHTERVYDCAFIVISPGVPSSAPVVLEAQKRGIKIMSELEVGSWFCRAPIVAITGSNGKTTTTALTGEILEHAKRKHVVAGNIGTAFSSLVSDLTETDVAVLEVSSFQLDYISTFRPRISALLNITPDHMDRYDHSMEKYAASKARVFENQSGDDAVMYDADDEWTAKVIGKAHCRKLAFSVKRPLPEGAFLENGMLVTVLAGERSEIVQIENIFIKGTHNIYNAMASALAGQLLGVDTASIRSTLETFKGVEHRLEFVRNLNGIRYYNDSKATNVDSVWYALQAFKRPIVLILGGRDKGNDYSRLNELVKEHVRTIVAIGESSDTVEKAFRGTAVVKKAGSMDEAVSTAKFLAEPGDIVLLSPACASFDWFRNYEHRGEIFKELVNAL